MGTRSKIQSYFPAQCNVRALPSLQELKDAQAILEAGPVRTETRGILFFKRTKKVGAPRQQRREAAALIRRVARHVVRSKNGVIAHPRAA